MELNRNPENYFAEVEQAAFEPSNVVPGIGFSPDKVLQARVLSYSDAHRYRLGVNYHQVPVNRPLAPVATYNRDGTMRVDANGGGAVDYEPSSFGGAVEDPSIKEPPLLINGAADRYVGFPCDDEDYYHQPRMLWEHVLDDVGRRHLVENIVASMSKPGYGHRRSEADPATDAATLVQGPSGARRAGGPRSRIHELSHGAFDAGRTK